MNPASQSGETNPGREGNSCFVTTHWSVVVAAGGADSEPKRVALEKLGQVYWYPLYAFVRRLGHQPQDAEDLVQSFFAVCLEKTISASRMSAKGASARSSWWH
jgi:hypothetical protein